MFFINSSYAHFLVIEYRGLLFLSCFVGCRSPLLARGACCANRPRLIAVLAGIAAPAGQRGPLGAGRQVRKLQSQLLWRHYGAESTENVTESTGKWGIRKKLRLFSFSVEAFSLFHMPLSGSLYSASKTAMYSASVSLTSMVMVSSVE